MVATTPDSPTTLEPIVDQIFEFLWGEERDPIPSAGDHAYERIWRQLITGARKPGERLSDVELAAQLGVSRTPVRQAAPRLRIEDLETQLDQLRAVRARMEEHPGAPFLRHDFQLHNLLIGASNNSRLSRILAALRSQVSFFQIRDTGYPRRMEVALAGHEGVLLALLDGRTEDAAQLVANHITAAKAGVLADMFAISDGKEVLPNARR